MPLSCCLAQAGNKILGVDKNEYVLDTLSNDQLPFYEQGLSELFAKCGKNFIGFTGSYKDAILNTNVSIILVNTQLGDDGYSAELVESAVKDIAINLKHSNKDYHTIILSSTVLPGTIKNLIKTVEKISNRKYKHGFGFAYVPDFVRLGCVIEDFKKPEFFLVGANHQRDIDTVHKVWKNFHENNPKTFTLTLEETEVAKVSLNAYIVSKISFCNFLGCLCDDMDNVDVHNITSVIGLDKRISPYFFKAGTPYGGTCFPRDTAAFIKFAKDRGHNAKHIVFCDSINDLLYSNIIDKLSKYDNIGILGVSFKPNSPVTIGSPSARIINILEEQGKKVHLHDNILETFQNIDTNATTYNSAQDCIKNSEIVILMHFDNCYKKLDYKNTKIIDPWGVLND